MESLEHRGQLVSRDPLPRITHADLEAFTRHERGDVNHAPGRRVPKRIVQEVRENLLEPDVVTKDPRRFGACDKAERHSLGLEPRHDRGQCGLRHAAPVEPAQRQSECMLLGGSNLAQVGRESAKPVDLISHRRPGCRIVGENLVLHPVDIGLERGQRRTKLMREVREQPGPRGLGLREPLRHVGE